MIECTLSLPKRILWKLHRDYYLLKSSRNKERFWWFTRWIFKENQVPLNIEIYYVSRPSYIKKHRRQRQLVHSDICILFEHTKNFILICQFIIFLQAIWSCQWIFSMEKTEYRALIKLFVLKGNRNSYKCGEGIKGIYSFISNCASI